MADWWDGLPQERFWCEVTDRRDIGADLKCPQTDEEGHAYWSYSLIHSVVPGDVVFHYSTREKAIVGASVAGGPVEERPIIWAPHGTVGRKKRESRAARPGWWRPLYGFVTASDPLSLSEVNEPQHQQWIREWTATKGIAGPPRLPFQLYPGALRGAQGYLTKMPYDFVQRWSQLSGLETGVAATEERLAPMAEIYPTATPEPRVGELRLKSADDYLAIVRGGVQRRTRNHERLIATAAAFLTSRGAKVTNPHPIDLLVTEPYSMILEGKVTSGVGALLAVRAAVGQLFEDRRFLGPRDADLCILLDRDPGQVLIQYIEEELGLFVMWTKGARLNAGEVTARRFSTLCE